jgi:HKD family nuclease
VAGSLALAAPAEAGKSKHTYTPRVGALFNIPVGNAGQRLRIEHHLIDAIKHAKKKSKIKIAAYSLDRMSIARALGAAKKRGVRVQVLLNDHQVTGAQRYLHRALGTNRHKKNFIYECDSGCRAQKTEYNNLHSKFYLFEHTGKARYVTMLGSANMTLNAVKWQWNDLWTTTDNKTLFDNFVALFKDMKVDYDVRQPTYEFCGDRGTSMATGCTFDNGHLYNRVFPRVGGEDPVKQLLDGITCVYDTPSGQKHTSVSVSMHTMRGKRGERLADAIRQKYAEGCNFRLIFGLMGFYVKQKLTAPTARGRMPLRSTGFDINGDGEVERYTHQKYAVIDGLYRGRIGGIVFTGSSNWSSLGLPQDEISFSIKRNKIARQYERNFHLMWQPRYSRNAYTTTYSVYRSVRMVDGRPVTTLERRPVVTVRPDHLRPGRTWEND